MVEWFESFINSLPPPVGLILTASFPILAIVGAAGAVVAAWRRHRVTTLLLVGLAMFGFATTIMWTMVMTARVGLP